jgi:thymidylate synthase (FAD)
MPPRVYLVSETSFDLSEMETFLRDNHTSWKRTPGTTAADQTVEAAGRICYMSFGRHQSPRDNGEYVKHLVNQGHESVLEHVSWGFLITGVSRAFTHQLVRHRVGFSFSQLSQQYHEETEAEFVEPHVDLPPQAKEAWDRAITTAKKAYADILDSLRSLENQPSQDLCLREIRRAIRSTARGVLPNATETKIWATVNARALRHFLSLRGSIPGDLEMRQVAAELLRIVKRKASSLFFDFDIDMMSDGSPIVIHRAEAAVDSSSSTTVGPGKST